MSIDKKLFKEAMAQFATGVTVVTTRHNDNNFGITANAFCSVSLDPTLVLVCVAKQLYTHEQIQKSGVFAVNILSVDQMDLGNRFAGRDPELADRFAGIDYKTSVTGSPILPGTLSWVDCELRHAYDGGDHTIFVGEAVSGEVSMDGSPLLYYDRHWSQLAAEGPDAGSSWPNEEDEE